MSSQIVRILFAIFLLAHGWVHMSLTQVPIPKPGALRTPFFPAWWRRGVDPAWPAYKLGLSEKAVQTLGWVLWLLVVAAYSLAAALYLLMPSYAGLWQGFTAAGSLLSLVLLALYWHPWLPVGVLIDLLLLSAVFLRWPRLP